MAEHTTARPRAIEKVNASLGRRYARERRFKAMGLGAVVLGLLFVSALFLDIVSKGYSAFVQTHIQLEVYFDPEVHRALRLRAAANDRSISDMVNDAVKASLSEDADDVDAFDLRRKERSISFESFVRGLKRRGRL